MPSSPAGLHALGGVGVIADDALDIPILDLLGEGAMRGLALVRGRHDRQPVALVPARAPAKMGELDHHRRAMLVAGVGELPDPGHDLVLVGEDIVEGRRAVARDRRRTRRHRQRNAGFGPLDVIGAVALLRHAVFRIGRLMRGRHDPVAQRQMLELVGLKQRIVGHRPPSRTRPPAGASARRDYKRICRGLALAAKRKRRACGHSKSRGIVSSHVARAGQRAILIGAQGRA